MNAALEETNVLPDGWKLKPIGEIVQPTRPRISPSQKPELPFLGMDHIQAQTMRMLGSVSASTMKSSAVHFQPGDVLYGRLRPYLNKVFQPHFEGLCSAEFIVFPETDELDNKYLQYFLNSSTFVRHATSLNSGDRPRVKFEQLAPYEMPVPPTVEQQKRIVAKIEDLFSHVDAGIEALNKAKQLLKQYRQSVLKAAVTGELTKEWREANKDKLEPVSKLLERILKERRQKWEDQQQEEFKAKGKMPKDDKWKGKYKDPDVVETLPFNVPDSWQTISLDTLLFNIETGKSFKCDERPPEEGETGIVKVSAVTWGEFDSEESKTITNKEKINPVYRIKVGDFLFSRANTIELVGACVIVKEVNRDLLLSDKIHRFVLPNEWKEWVRLCLRTRHGRNEIESLATGNQDSMRNISQGSVRKIRIPLLSEDELKEVISRVNQKIDGLQRLESEIEVQLIKADKNKQSVLASAFIGKIN